MDRAKSKTACPIQTCVLPCRLGFGILCSTKSTKGDTHMVRREKGFKRYAGQRERRFTDPLIREDEYERARAAAERIASRHTGGRADSEDIHNIHRDE